MNIIIKLVAQYQTKEAEEIFEKLVIKFKNLINHYAKNITGLYEEDLYQELLFTLFNVIKKFNFKLFKNLDKSLFNKDILEILEKNKFKNINIIFENQYLLAFLNK